MAQFVQPVKGDYSHTITATLREVGITSTMQEITNMTKTFFRIFLKQKCDEAGYQYLIQKQARGSKGVEINYIGLQMADYLLPQENMSLEDQQELFSIGAGKMI